MSNTMSPQNKTKRILTVAGLMCCALVFFAMGSVRKEKIIIITAEESKTNEVTEAPIELPDLDGCTIGPATAVELPTSNTNKPFWVPSYPASDNGLFVELVVGLTGGVGSNAKSYYASSPVLKKCFSKNEIGRASCRKECRP